MTRSYFDHGPWVTAAFAAIKNLSAGATFDQAYLTTHGLCNSDEEWLILTNRLVAKRDIYITSVSQGTYCPPNNKDNFGANFYDPARKGYPELSLVGLYSRVAKNVGNGKTASVVLHDLTKDTTWKKKGDRVAIKLLEGPTLDELSKGQVASRERLNREFRVGRQHASDRLVKMFDVFQTDLFSAIRGGESHVYGLVMEQIDGENLAKSTGFPLRERLRRAAELTEAVNDFHGTGYIHRDIKRENAIVRTDGTVVLVDYGIAKAPADSTITGSVDSVFTTRCAAPEQIRAPNEERQESDIYALGVTIWELLVETNAYGGTPSSGILHEKQKPLSLPTPSSLWSPELRDLISRMTDPDRECRPVIQDVRRVLQNELAKTP
jgi:serine/threonine protein kinase